MGKSKKRDSGDVPPVTQAPSSDEAHSTEPDASPSFEHALAQLETTVARLEAGDMPLEEALELFENGIKLSRQCATTLEAAEERIAILVADRENGDREGVAGWHAETFSRDELDDDEEFDAAGRRGEQDD